MIKLSYQSFYFNKEHAKLKKLSKNGRKKYNTIAKETSSDNRFSF